MESHSFDVMIVMTFVWANVSATEAEPIPAAPACEDAEGLVISGLIIGLQLATPEPPELLGTHDPPPPGLP